MSVPLQESVALRLFCEDDIPSLAAVAAQRTDSSNSKGIQKL
jgi:hypothetical protein